MTPTTTKDTGGVQEYGVGKMIVGPTFQNMMKQAMPDLGVTPARLTRTVLTEFRKIPLLAKCDPSSFYRAVMTCAELALIPGRSLGLCWILPFKDKGKLQATFVLGYPGAASLAWRSNMMETMSARVVYADEPFKIRGGTDEAIEHEPATIWAPDRDVLGFYATLRVKAAERSMFHWMPLGEVLHFRDQYVRAKSGPWFEKPQDNGFRWMAQKTCFKQVAKLGPRSDEMQGAWNADDQGTMGLPPELDVTDEANLLMQMEAEGEEVNRQGGFGAGLALEPEVLGAEDEDQSAKPKHAARKEGESPCNSPIEGGCIRKHGHNQPCANATGDVETFS